MHTFGKALGRLLLGLIVVVAGIWIFGAREPVDTVVDFDPATIDTDLDGYFSRAEAAVPNIRSGAEKRIIWFGPSGVQTDVAVLYVHGFSADAEEIRPVPDKVAAGLGANLIFTRLAGHGRDAAAMVEPSAGDWIEDLAEGLAVSRKAGTKVIVISTSTGGTLAALAALDPALRRSVSGIVFISPNFGIANPRARILTWPFARLWVPLVAGRERAIEAMNDEHAKHWTTRYPTVAALPMAALVKYTAAQDFTQTDVPALFMFSDADAVVRPDITRAIAARWGGAVTLAPVDLPPGSDPYNHVIAGDILSPSMNEATVQTILNWAAPLVE